MRCPCCGTEVDKVDPASVVNEIKCGPMMRKYFDGLVASFGRRVSKGHMLDFMYGDDPEGGPDNATNILSVFKCQSRKRLAAVGIEVVTIWGDGLRMQWIAQEAANDAGAGQGRARPCTDQEAAQGRAGGAGA